ncbi:MAG: hypothetical protein RL272_709 [Candidatus Parcubacteria bacterium]|jgi:Tfp pilus assembly protein PilX
MRKLLRFISGLRADRRGFALIVTTVLLGVVIAVSLTLLDVSLTDQRTARYVERTQDAVLIAEAGVHKALFCLKATGGALCGGAYGPSYAGQSNVGFADGRFSVTVADSGTDKVITSVGTSAGGVSQTVRTTVNTTAPSQAQSGFNYSVQTSDLGVVLQNNAHVNNGTVYTDSDVVCGNNADINYDIYVSKVGGKIDNCDGVIEAHADRILNSQVLGDAYYRNNPADIAGTTVGGAKHPNQPTPAPRTLPVFNKQFWEDVAESGGIINGNLSPANGSSLGPVKILGNLTLSNNVFVTLTGPVWVVGNVSISNNAGVGLAAGFGASSGVLIADDPADNVTDGKVDIGNNGFVTGSGIDGSYVLLYSANTGVSDAAPAIKIANNAAGGIFYAPFGSIHVYNNGNAVATVARRVYMDNNAYVTYDSAGVTPASMSIATANGGIWRFLQGVWQQFK